MGRRSRKAAAMAASGEPTEAREALERRWRDRLTFEPCLATLVTAEGARREPFHRWIPYKQGYSPGLVRQFLAENHATQKRWTLHPVLDPFCGSGTCVVECSRHGVCAIGVEALESLVFLTRSKFAREFPRLPATDGASTWQQLAGQFELPVHRAALMLAIGRQHTTAGRANRGAKPLEVLLSEVAGMMGDDLSHPLTRLNRLEVGDARRITSINDGAIGAILTSPPYLSRHDYARITSPYDVVYRYWYGGQGRVEQVRAHGRDRVEGAPTGTIAAAEEAAEWLRNIGQTKLASVVRGYFQDITMALYEFQRVLVPGGVCWTVIGGARIKDVYVPSDVIVAEIAERCGFYVEAVRVARDLVGAKRKFGRLGYVAPRESLLVMHHA